MIHTDFKHNVLKDVPIVKVTSYYGMRYLFGILGMHNGIDVRPEDRSLANILAYERALVKQVGYTLISGYYIILEHGDNTLTGYRHLAKGSTTVKVGQVVERDSVIGLEGNTGKVTGYHLHFDVKINGAWVNPLPYLQGIKDIKPYKETYTMNRPELPKLKVIVNNLYYRDRPNGLRQVHLLPKEYIYLGKTEVINGYEWGQIILDDGNIGWVGLDPKLNQIIPVAPVIKEVIKVVEKIVPFNASLTKDGMLLNVSIAPIK